MESEIIKSFLQLIIFLPCILILIYLLGRVTSKIYVTPPGKYMKVIEKLSLSKEGSILIVKIGEKVCVVSSTNNEIRILRELDGDEIKILEEKSNNYEESIKKYSDIWKNRRKHKK
ncbi:flagellar biosynthetic protein FliO [Clostridium sp. CTA-19]